MYFFILVLSVVAAVVHAELKQPSSDSVENTEVKIVSQMKSLIITENDPKKEEKETCLAQLETYIKPLGAMGRKLVLAMGESIRCYFICTYEEELQQLRQHYESGLMKKVLEKIFTLLADNEETVFIRHLKWDFIEYSNCVQHLSNLKEPIGQSV